MKNTLENAIKAAQCTDLLVSDLRELLKTCDQVVGLLVLQEIKVATEQMRRLDALVTALKG